MFECSSGKCSLNLLHRFFFPRRTNWIWIKDLLSMTLPTRARLSFTHSQFVPSGSLHKPLILLHQRTDRRSKTIIPQSPEWKPQSQKANQNDHMDHSHVELNEAMSHAMQDSRQMGHGGEFWQNMVHWRKERQTTSVFLPRESHEQYEKAERYDTGRWAAQVRRCPICYWGRMEK